MNRPRGIHSLALRTCVLFLLQGNIASAAQQQVTVATVNDQTISLATVHFVLDRTLSRTASNTAPKEHNDATIKAGIEHCIDREVVFQFLQSGKFETLERETDQLLDDWESELKLTGQKLKDFLEDSRLSEAEFRHQLAWRSSWRKYATKYVTEAHLQKQFELKRRQLDGTKVHVAQILWKNTTEATSAAAKQVRVKLVNNEIDWSTAVETHSESASAKNEGDLGWIKFSGPMPRRFTDVAFKLEAGEFSKPFTSRFGTHLIRCISVEAGTMSFEDVAETLRETETKRLFSVVAKRHRPNAKIDLIESAAKND